MGLGRHYFLILIAVNALFTPIATAIDGATVIKRFVDLRSCDGALEIASNTVIRRAPNDLHLLGGRSTIIEPRLPANVEPVPEPAPQPEPSRPRLSDFARQTLEADGYHIENDSFSFGGQAVLALATRKGERVLIKEVHGTGEKDKEHLLLVAESVHAALPAIAAKHESKPEYFIVPRIRELAEDGSHPVLEIPFFPRTPDSKESAPSLKWRLEHDFVGMETIEKRLAIFDHIVEAVLLSHKAGEKGIIHRDLKPGNILIDDHGNVRIVDFGLSAMKGAYPPGTDKGYITGTPDYMSENAILGEPAHPVDDLHALRKIAWELVNGMNSKEGKAFERPFFSKNRGIIDYKHAPEGGEVPDALALAVWSRLPQTAAEYANLIHSARTTSEVDFFKHYGNLLKEVESKDADLHNKQDTAAYDLLGSLRAINEFPEGLGLSGPENKSVRDNIIAGAVRLREGTKDGKLHLIGPHPYLYFDAFFARVKEWTQHPSPDSELALPSAIPPMASPDIRGGERRQDQLTGISTISIQP